MGRINVISLILVDSDVQHVGGIISANACVDAAGFRTTHDISNVFLDLWWAHGVGWTMRSRQQHSFLKAISVRILGRSPQNNYKNDLDDQT